MVRILYHQVACHVYSSNLHGCDNFSKEYYMNSPAFFYLISLFHASWHRDICSVTWVWQFLQGILHEFTYFFLSNLLISRFLAQGHLLCYMQHQTVLALSSLPMKSLWPLRTVVGIYQLTWHIPEHLDLQFRNTTLITSSMAKLTLCLCLIKDHVVVRKSWVGVCSHFLNLRNT
jgi:hypothetical protein